jgi:glyoxylase-like metal-dependent hydrolase (beta-lactamase superfamily II)
MSLLPSDIFVFERGWLSSNNILLLGEGEACLVDSGYSSHAPLTLSLITSRLGSQPLRRLFNTHLHSDHCGGNAILQSHYSDLMTFIPSGQADFVRHWDPVLLSYSPSGQTCHPFSFDATLNPGESFSVGRREWQIHAAPGHDPHSFIFFDPESRILISADALWENGFGVVFPEIEGLSAFREVSDTLDLIESLNPELIIPGHGSTFTSVAESISIARKRLDYFVSDPRRHALHAAKVLLKFKLLEVQQFSTESLFTWFSQTPYCVLLHRTHFAHLSLLAWTQDLAVDLVRSGAARQDGGLLLNA